MSKKDFCETYWGTLSNSRSKSRCLHTILCICFECVMMSEIKWNHFQDNLRYISLYESGKWIFVDFSKMKRGKGSEFSNENSWKTSILRGIFYFQVVVENFLEQISPCSRYLKCCPNIALSNGKKIRVMRHIDRKIFKENQKLNPKK